MFSISPDLSYASHMLKRVDLLFPTLLLGRSELAFGLVTDCFDVDVDVEIE